VRAPLAHTDELGSRSIGTRRQSGNGPLESGERRHLLASSLRASFDPASSEVASSPSSLGNVYSALSSRLEGGLPRACHGMHTGVASLHTYEVPYTASEMPPAVPSVPLAPTETMQLSGFETGDIIWELSLTGVVSSHSPLALCALAPLVQAMSQSMCTD